MDKAFTDSQEEYNRAQLEYNNLKQQIYDLNNQLKINDDTEADFNGEAALSDTANESIKSLSDGNTAQIIV